MTERGQVCYTARAFPVTFLHANPVSAAVRFHEKSRHTYSDSFVGTRVRVNIESEAKID